jgi:cation transport ATPase
MTHGIPFYRIGHPGLCSRSLLLRKNSRRRPMLAGAAMGLSSVTVVLNALQLRKVD